MPRCGVDSPGSEGVVDGDGLRGLPRGSASLLQLLAGDDGPVLRATLVAVGGAVVPVGEILHGGSALDDSDFAAEVECELLLG